MTERPLSTTHGTATSSGGKVRDVLLNLWVAALLVLLIGGGGAGWTGAYLLARKVGLLDIEPALGTPIVFAGVAVGGMAGLGLALLIRTLPDLARERSVGRLVLVCVFATALGAVLYLAFVGILVWLVGLLLPDTPTAIVAVILSIIGLPVAGPITYQLMSGRRANEVRGGRPMPGWVYRVRRPKGGSVERPT
jgi:hypothetical protein